MLKILIIRFSSIGDIVLTTPVMRCLKTQLPSAEVHYLTKGIYADLLKDNPYIDKLFTIQESTKEVARNLRQENYDHVIDLHRNFRSASILVRLRKPFSAFPKLNIRKWILVHFKINALPDIHIVQRYIRAARKFGISYDGQGLDFFLPPGVPDIRAALPDAFHENYLLLAAGGLHNTKQMPVMLMAEFCKLIQYPVLIAGSETDRERAEAVIRESGGVCFNGCGKFTLAETAFLLSKAKTVVSSDSGLMHVAAAFKVPVVSVWGNTVPSFGMYPLFPDNKKDLSAIIELKGLKCRPCSKLGKKKCPKGHFRCMNMINVSEILSKVISLSDVQT